MIGNRDRNSQVFNWMLKVPQTGMMIPLTLSILLFPQSSFAQPIIPAQDGTGTLVNPQGNQFNIEGGQLSGDNQNLFHSFEKLGLPQGQILNFISNPEIQNILGRVTGGEASFINGLIQVTGGNSNLFLMNPAGIIFGANASLNIPADFTATTATGIGFGNNNWFNAFGENNWTNLVGTPNEFIFNPLSPGSIANFGNLAVPTGGNLTLLAGTVLNTGTLSAPEGQITVASVTGENLIRISQAGHLLNLELPANTPQQSSTVTALSLPELLTGGELETANQVQVNEQGQIILTRSGVTVPTNPGTTIISGNLDVSSLNNTGGNLQLAGEQVGLIDSILNASGLTGGGTILIGGDYKGLGDFPTAQQTFISADSFINANALEQGNGGQVIVWSEQLTQSHGAISVQGGIVSGNGGFVETSSRGILEVTTAPNISAPAGQGGTWLLDPNNIEIVATTDFNTNPIFLDDDELLFQTTNDNAQLSAALLISALSEGDVVVETGTAQPNSQDGNITFLTSLDFNGIGGERTLTLNAAANIILNGQSIIDSVPTDGDALNLIFQGDFVNNTSGAIYINNATINTNGGDFIAIGRGSNLLRGTNFPIGVNIGNSTINTLGGDITLDGIGANDQPFNHGVFINNSQILSNGGDVTLTGQSGTGIEPNVGVWLEQSTLSSSSGDVSITGFTQGTESNNIGILINNLSTVETGLGNLILTGESNSGINNNFGVNINDQSQVLTTDGSLQINGTATGVDGVTSVYLNNSNVASTGTGTINIQGINNATGNNNDGIALLNTGTIFSTGTGTITLSGTSGKGVNSEGVIVFDGQLQTLDGDININGVGQGSTASHGVYLGGSSQVLSSGIGDINLDGLSSGTESGNHGILLFGNVALATTGTGNILLVGSSSESRNSSGIFILDNPVIQAFNGNIDLIGVSNAEFTGYGILAGNTQFESQGSGNINLLGTGDGSGSESDGILLFNNTEINNLGSGNINVIGRSGSVPDSEAVGIFASQIETSTGSIVINGISNGENTTSVVIGENTPLTTTNLGSITVTGNRDISISSITNPGGEINVISTQGNINSSFGTLNSSSVIGNGGTITVEAAESVTVGGINSSTTANFNTFQAGNVVLSSTNNNIITLTQDINTSATQGQGSNITLDSPVQLIPPNITFNTTGTAGSGNIIFNNTVDGSDIGTNSLILQAGTGTVTFNGLVGSLNPLNRLSITARDINSNAALNVADGGLIINSTGLVNLADIIAINNGSITVNSTGNIVTENLTTAGQPITLNSSEGGIDTTAGTIDSLSTATTGGSVNFTAANSIRTGTIITGGETINLTSINGDIDTSNGILNSGSSNSDGGDINVEAATEVILGEINTSSESETPPNQAGSLEVSSGTNRINLTADINTSAPSGQGSAINFDADVILTEPTITLNTTGGSSSGNVTFNGTVNGGSLSEETPSTVTSGINSLTIESGQGNVTFNQEIGNLVPLQNLNITGGDVVTQSTVNVDNGGVNINAAGTVNLSETVTAINNSIVDVTAEGDITTNNITNEGERINLISNTGNIDTRSGALNSSSTTNNGGEIFLDANQDLTIGEINTRTTSNLGTSQAGTLTLNAGDTTTLTENINTSATQGSGNNIIFNSPVIVDAPNLNLTSSGTLNSGDVTFNNTVEGSSANLNNLTIQAGEGTVTFNQAVGETNRLQGLEITGGDINSNAVLNVGDSGLNIDANSNVNLTETVTATNTGTLTINAEENITTANLTTEGQAIAISSNNGTIDTSGGILNSSSQNNGGDINVTTTGTVTLGGINTSSETNQAGTFTVNGESITLTDNIDTSGNTGSNITFTNPVQLNQPITITTLGTLTSGNIIFNNTVTGETNNLTLQAGTGDIEFNNNVTVGGLDINARNINSSAPITVETENLTMNSSGTVTLSQPVNATNNSQVNINASQDIITNEINTNGQPITLTSTTGQINTQNGRLNTSSVDNNGGDINVNAAQTINLGEINTSTASTSPTSQAGTLALTTENNPIIFNNNINTSATAGIGGQLIINSPLQLNAPVTLTTSGTASSGNIIFNSDINGDNNLTLNAGSGNIRFTTVGNTNPLSNLQVNTTGITTLQGNLTVNNNVDFTNATGGTQLATDVTINTTGNNGNILFNNSPITGSQIFTLNAGNGDISLGNVGNNINPLSGLRFSQAATVNLFGDIYTAGGLNFSSVNTVNIAGNSVTLDTSTDNSSVSLINSILTGAGQLTINTGNNDVNLDTFSSTTPPIGLTINARTVQANSPVIVGSEGLNINSSNNVSLNSNTLSDGTVVINADANLNIRDITASDSITLNSSNGNITTNNLNSSSTTEAGGETSLSTPNGNISTGNINTSSTLGIGGEISLSSTTGTVTTGNLLTSGTIGGNVTVQAQTRITTGQINTSGQTQGGNVFLDPINDVEVAFINAEGGSGRGGNVFVESTQGYFRALDSFPTAFSPTGRASISTAGQLGGGSITIRHAGGPLNPLVSPFEVGQNLTVNGTAATITSGTFSITSPQTFPGSFTLGNITIQTDDAPNNNGGISPGNPINSDNVGIRINQDLINSNQVNSEANLEEITTRLIDSSQVDILPQELLETTDMAFQTNNLDTTVVILEQLRSQEFEEYLGISSNILSRFAIQEFLKELELQTQQVYAVIYVVSRQEQLEVIVVPSSGEPIRHSVPDATAEKLFATVRTLQSEITSPRKRNTSSYQEAAQQLHQWIIEPIQADLQRLNVSTLLFSLDPGLRSMPVATLWDGNQFLVEQYAISIIPSTSLVDFRYQPIGDAEVLAMGASQFTDQNPLPAVPVELDNINRLWQGREFLNELFTLENLKSQRRESDFEVIHLATHADFKPGTPSNSYIQLWNEKLPLSELTSLNWDNPKVELLVLSACRTALGDRRAELGFAGLAVQAGVKSALASLWYVSDQGTLALMSEFYYYLQDAPIKVIALRDAQLSMIRGEARIENNQLITTFGNFPLPPELADTDITNLSHPYYWSGFTMIGSPW